MIRMCDTSLERALSTLDESPPKESMSTTTRLLRHCRGMRLRLVCVAALATFVFAVRAIVPASPRPVLIVRSAADPPAFTVHCPAQRCTEIVLESFACPVFSRPVATVIFTGHSAPPSYLHQSPEMLARVVACYEPELVVLDTCYGFSSPLLAAIARVRPSTLIVGATYKLPPDGLRYRDAFFMPGSIDERAGAIEARSGAAIERWRVDGGSLEAALDDVARWDAGTLTAHLQRKLPNLVRVPLPGSSATALVPVPSSRFVP